MENIEMTEAKKSTYSEAKKRNNAKWDSVNLDRMSIALPKGTKSKIKQAAADSGLSVNAWINQLIESALAKED